MVVLVVLGDVEVSVVIAAIVVVAVVVVVAYAAIDSQANYTTHASISLQFTALALITSS